MPRSPTAIAPAFSPKNSPSLSHHKPFSANIPGILKVKILVEGKQRETLAGHADLSNFFDVSAVKQLARQLQSINSGQGCHHLLWHLLFGSLDYNPLIFQPARQTDL